MKLFEVSVEGRPRATVRATGVRQYEVDLGIIWPNEIEIYQTPKKNGIEMVLSDEATACKFMDDLVEALHNVELIEYGRGRMPPDKEVSWKLY